MTKEQMIEEIREKVIMANNPECKTYEEALEEEGLNGDCYCEISDGKLAFATKHQLLAQKYGLNGAFGTMIRQLEYSDEESEDDEDEQTGIYCRSMTDGIDTHEVLKYINRVKDYIISDERGKISRVIGLPITLERVLVCLNKRYFSDGTRIFRFNPIGEPEDWSMVSWQPNKTLDQQSEETIKAIYDILCI
jgi:hypothetical protein